MIVFSSLKMPLLTVLLEGLNQEGTHRCESSAVTMTYNQKKANKLVSCFRFTVEIDGDLELKLLLTSASFLSLAF